MSVSYSRESLSSMEPSCNLRGDQVTGTEERADAVPLARALIGRSERRARDDTDGIAPAAFGVRRGRHLRVELVRVGFPRALEHDRPKQHLRLVLGLRHAPLMHRPAGARS